jgi:hypothetical protein
VNSGQVGSGNFDLLDTRPGRDQQLPKSELITIGFDGTAIDIDPTHASF